MTPFLMISPMFPPSRAIGAKRALHFCRHLPALGWKPCVVALSEDTTPDPDLVPLVPDVPIWRGFRRGPIARREDARGARPTKLAYESAQKPENPGPWAKFVRIFEGGFDRYTKYLPWAFPGALKFLREQDCRAIYVNAGPYSAMQLGAALSGATGVPLVLDLRDPWTIEPNWMKFRGPVGQRLADGLEAACFSRARHVVVTAESTADAYRALYRGRIPEARFHVIRNHFDPDLYGPSPPPPGKDGPFRIVYFGHLRAYKTAVEFLQAFRRLVDDEKLAPGDAVLVTLGLRTPADDRAIGELGLTGYVEDHPWLPFMRCRELLGTADLLLDIMAPRHELQISGKLYDYFACGRPILTIGPNPEIDRIFAATRAGRRVDLDVDQVYAALKDVLRAKRAGEPFAPDPKAIATFEARPAAEKLAALLDDATTRP